MPLGTDATAELLSFGRSNKLAATSAMMTNDLDSGDPSESIDIMIIVWSWPQCAPAVGIMGPPRMDLLCQTRLIEISADKVWMSYSLL
jgi:hypothetical protein